MSIIIESNSISARNKSGDANARLSNYASRGSRYDRFVDYIVIIITTRPQSPQNREQERD